MMRSPSPSLAVLMLLGAAACAHDGVLAPGSVPAPVPSTVSVLIRPAGSFVPRAGELVYVVDGVVVPALTDLGALDIVSIEVLKGCDLGGNPERIRTVTITTRQGQARSEP